MDIYFLGKWNSVWLFEEGKKKNLKEGAEDSHETKGNSAKFYKIYCSQVC